VTAAVVVLLAVLLAVTCATALAGGVVLSRPSAVSRRVRSRVLVTLKSGAAFDGVLASADRSAWVLRNAQALAAGEDGGPVPVDGEVLILTGDIDYAQRP
jgi:small nuclear ribonucleoprotein (snRNP)-like protein